MFCLLYSGLIVFIHAMLKCASLHAQKNVSQVEAPKIETVTYYS
jgi:hypothetical protein